MTRSIEQYVSNADGDIFALRNLPEEVVAVLFAYYSRSPYDLRTNLRKLLADESLDVLDASHYQSLELGSARERARKFHEKFVVGYGHQSVAEHAVAHLATERVSIIAAKAIESHRLASYTEKSTRFVRMNRAALVRDVGLDPQLQSIYERGAFALLDAYEGLVARLLPVLAARHPEIDEATRNARAFDLLRGLLPAGVGTNVGITVGGRELAHMIRTLGESRLPECHRIARGLRDEGSHVMPTLLRHLDPSAHRAGARDRVGAVMESMGAAQDWASPGGGFWTPGAARRPAGHELELVDHHGLGLRDLAMAVLREVGDAAALAPGGRRNLSDEWALSVVNAYLSERGDWDAVCRALEHCMLTFVTTCDYGAWRDLQRHRIESATTPLLSPCLQF